MLLYFAVILLIAGGVTPHASDNCDKRIGEVCGVEKIPNKFPTTEEELDETCTPMLDYIGCGVNMSERCKIELEVLQVAKNFLTTTEEVCNKDTLLHAAIVSNLKCFDELLKEEDRKCYIDRPTMEKVSQTAEALIEEGLLTLTDNENETYTLYECIRAMHFFACYAVKIEDKCGTLAMDVYLELFQKIAPGAVDGDCDEAFTLLPAVIRLQKLEREKEKDIEEALRKRK